MFFCRRESLAAPVLNRSWRNLKRDLSLLDEDMNLNAEPLTMIARNALVPLALAALCALPLSACGHNMEQRAATGAIAGAVVAGPIGAAVGGAAGAAVDTVARPK